MGNGRVPRVVAREGVFTPSGGAVRLLVRHARIDDVGGHRAGGYGALRGRGHGVRDAR